jgi:glycosyltransferase involved in cell wall biosynthesis
MSSLYIIPIEPLVERYSESWYRNLPKEFEKLIQSYGLEREVVLINGQPLSNEVNVGTFLDINSTIHYKNSQMQEIAKLFHAGEIKDGDKFFITDLEFWGIESLRLMAQLNKVCIEIYGFLHAASYTIEDAFSVAAPYQRYTEVGWIEACDKVFVGTNYHKQAIVERRLKPLGREDLRTKIRVTGNPLFEQDYPKIEVEKKRQVIISNRFDYEKRPNLSLDFAYLLKKKDPSIQIIVTTSRSTFKSNKNWLVEKAKRMEEDGIISIHAGLSKAEYHQHLAESKVMLSNSIEEHYGYCIVEACLYNTAPLVKNAYSHPEILNHNNDYMFNDEDEIIEKALNLLDMEKRFPVYEYGSTYFKATTNIFKEMFGN